MYKHLLPIVLGLGLFLGACSTREADVTPPLPGASSLPGTETVPAMTEESLLQAWEAIPKDSKDNLDVPTAYEIARQLSEMGEDKLDLLFARLGNPEISPIEKMLIVISVTQFVRPGMADKLLAMTAPENELTTRAGSTHLYGLIDIPGVEENLKRLSEDPVHQVRMSALFVRQIRGDLSVIPELKTICSAEDARPADREQFILGFPEALAAENLDVFERAVQDPKLSESSQRRALDLLVHLGSNGSVAAIEQGLSANALNESLRTAAQDTITAIQQRLAASVTPAPPAAPAAPADAASPDAPVAVAPPVDVPPVS
ncbi:MAG: hypothetical protein HYV27_21335 [Candidatus Hydrogenedentes bacterium]|nr:hypothetical protein [Candidatus Hydrogenedentota bacterium]